MCDIDPVAVLIAARRTMAAGCRHFGPDVSANNKMMLGSIPSTLGAWQMEGRGFLSTLAGGAVVASLPTRLLGGGENLSRWVSGKIRRPPPAAASPASVISGYARCWPIGSPTRQFSRRLEDGLRPGRWSMGHSRRRSEIQLRAARSSPKFLVVWK